MTLKLSIGQVVCGRFQLERVLGSGGTAIVYLVRETATGSAFALKILTLSSPVIRDRMLREGEIQQQLQHLNIVRVVEILDLEGTPGLLMEHINGPSLESALGRYGLTLSDAETLFLGILGGVRAAHEIGLVHRDLKPANVLLARTPEGFIPKVTDFGLAKLVTQGDQALGATRAGIAMGTPSYMAPEQIRDARTVDRRADIWSLGCLLYELCTRQRAFPGDEALAIYNAVVDGDFVSPRRLLPDLPASIEEAIVGCLRVDPAERIPDCATLQAVLQGEQRWALPEPTLPAHAEAPTELEPPAEVTTAGHQVLGPSDLETDDAPLPSGATRPSRVPPPRVIERTRASRPASAAPAPASEPSRGRGGPSSRAASAAPSASVGAGDQTTVVGGRSPLEPLGDPSRSVLPTAERTGLVLGGGIVAVSIGLAGLVLAGLAGLGLAWATGGGSELAPSPPVTEARPAPVAPGPVPASAPGSARPDPVPASAPSAPRPSPPRPAPAQVPGPAPTPVGVAPEPAPSLPQPSPPSPPSPPPTSREPISVRVDTVPPGMMVQVNGRQTGLAPFVAMAAPGRVTVAILDPNQAPLDLFLLDATPGASNSWCYLVKDRRKFPGPCRR